MSDESRHPLEPRAGQADHIDADRLAESGTGDPREAALLEVARGLAGAIRIQEVMQSIARAGVEWSRAFGAYIEGVLPTSEEVEVLAAVGEGTPAVGTRVSYPGSLTEEIIDAGEPEILTELGAIGESMAPYLGDSCARCTGLVTPMISEGRAIGALVLLRSPEQGPFSGPEAVRARLLGDLAAVALRRVADVAALTSREERFRAVVQNAADAIVTVDEDDRIVFANPAASRIFGYDDGGILRVPAGELLAGGIRAAAEGPGRAEVRVTGRHRGGREIPLEATFGEFSEEGRRLVTAVMRDVSGRVRMEQERARLHESKARLIRGFGHDVKNPLGAADGYAALLEDGIYGEMTEKQRDSVGRIRRSIGTALGLIRELVEFSRAEAGELNVEWQDVDLFALLCEVAEDHRAAARAAGLALEFASARTLPRVSADPVRVRQVLGNLLSNAIKYTPEGGSIHIAADVVDGRVCIAIQDTGIGIPEEQQERLFHEFTRINPGATEGAGLGLAISQKIAHALGGEITVRSTVGQGSTFTLRLPAHHDR